MGAFPISKAVWNGCTKEIPGFMPPGTRYVSKLLGLLLAVCFVPGTAVIDLLLYPFR